MGSCVKAACPRAEAVRLCPSSGEEGSLGKISLSCCHFAGHMKNPSVPHYHLDFSSLPPIALFRKEILRWLKVNARMSCLITVSEAKRNIFAATRFQMAIDYQFREADREYPRNNKYVISIHPTSEVEEYYSALSTCYRSGSSSLFAPSRRWRSSSNTSNGACILQQPAPRRPVPTGGFVEFWFGHHQSLRIVWKPFINMDTIQRVFLMAGQVQIIMEEVLRARVVPRLLVVQKRHDTHLFLDSPREQCGRGKNFPPETGVDSYITLPDTNCFLVSQCPQVTRRPTDYHLCYVFVGCTRRVPYPTECFY